MGFHSPLIRPYFLGVLGGVPSDSNDFEYIFYFHRKPWGNDPI